MSGFPYTLPSYLGDDETRTVTLSGTGVLSATAATYGTDIGFPYTLPFDLGSVTRADLSATGTLSAVVRERYTRTSTLSATGSLSAVARQSYTRSASLSGDGTLLTTGSGGLGERAMLSSEGTLAAVAGKTEDSFTAPLSTVGVLSAVVVGNVMTEPSTTPEWAESVNAFTAASRKSFVATTATQLQFPSTNQLTGVCGNLFSGSAFTNGLLNYGDPNTQGVAGAMVGGTQSVADSLCGFVGGAGVDTTPQAVVTGASDVQGAIDGSPMASGTIALGQNGQPTNNVALDAINGVQNLANTLYSILQVCGCGAQNDPTNVGPQQVIDTTQETADGVTNSPFASGIIAMGQGPASGNVALDAINGIQTFANSLFSILSICGCAPAYSPENVEPQTVVDVAQATSDAVADNPFAQDFVTGNSGNLAADAMFHGQDLVDSIHQAVANSSSTGTTLSHVVTTGRAAISQNTANHAGHKSLTAAQSVVLKDQNLLVSQAFSTANTVMPDPDGNWVWDGTQGAVTLGCLKVIANGTLLEYVSSEVPVTAGETIELTCNVEYSGLSYTGSDPIGFGVQKYRLGRTPAGDTTYLDVGGYDVSDTDLQSPGASSGWVDVAGTYVVEPGVDQVRFRFKVAANCSAGTIRFDEANLLKVDLIADECAPGIGTTVDNIVTQLYGAQGSGFTHNDAAVALANTAAALTTATAKLASLTAEGHTSAIAGDDFSWTGEITASANWGGEYLANPGLSSGTAHYSAAGGDAVWTDGIFPRTARYKWEGVDQHSDTDYQLMQTVLSSGFYTARGYRLSAQIHLLGRIADDWSSYDIAKVDGLGTYSVGHVIDDVYTEMDSGTLDSIPGAGSTVSFYCGDAATVAPRHFTLKVNEQVITDFDEVGTDSPVGASNRGWGWGGYANATFVFALITFLPASGLPPKVNQWIAMDQ